jgi:hypothetical protein
VISNSIVNKKFEDAKGLFEAIEAFGLIRIFEIALLQLMQQECRFNSV